jgi:hypothetical protein
MKYPMSEKTPEMVEAIESMFPGTKAAIAAHKCPMCQSDIEGFRDALSKREYEISGLCQKCQDFVFGGGE